MMETVSLFIVGFLFGLRHAFDADHIAAVASLGAESRRWKDALGKGIFWGLGHTAVLFGIGILLFLFEIRLPASLGVIAEKIIGVVLIVFGVRAFWIFFRSRKKLNTELMHSHPPMGLHIHRHPSFWIGALHGLAGSAAVFVLIVSTFRSAFLALLYILVFGIGSMVGMALVGIGVGLSANRFQKYTGAAAGVFSLFMGFVLFLS